MKPPGLVAVLILAGLSPGASVADNGPIDQAGRAAQPGGSTAGQGIRDDASRAKRELRDTARKVRENIRSGAAKLKRELAVAECNDGRYSYTRHDTCNRHGGVKQYLR